MEDVAASSLHIPCPWLLHDQLSSLVSHSGVDGTCQPHSTHPTTGTGGS